MSIIILCAQILANVSHQICKTLYVDDGMFYCGDLNSHSAAV